MASKALLRRKKEEKRNVKKFVVQKEREQLEKCPVFKVHYLGKVPARGEYGREFIDEPVETLLKLKDRLPKLPKTVLQITEKGFRFSDVNGPFGRERHILIPIHHICYGVASEQNPQVFAIITRTDSNPENSLLECHAFLCDRRKVAAQITYWLLRTFLQVFEELQRKRRIRQAQKMRRQQIMMALAEQPAGNRLATGFDNSNLQMYDVPPSSPTGSLGPDIYSVTVEGSKEKGEVTAVRLTKNIAPVLGINARSQPLNQTENIGVSGGNKFATLPVMRSSFQEEPAGSGARQRQPVPQMYKSQDTLKNFHPPLKLSNSTGTSSTDTPPVTLRKARNAGLSPSRPHSFSEGRSTGTLPKDPQNQAPAHQHQAPPFQVESPGMNGLSNPNAPLHHQRQERARYMRNVTTTRTSPTKPPENQGRTRPANLRLSSVGESSSSVSESRHRGSASQDNSDFIFIRMLQEEFSEVGSTDANSTIFWNPNKNHKRPTEQSPKASPSSPSPAPPLDQKLPSEAIEKRIREWLTRTSPDAEMVSFDDSGLDRISLAGTLARHNSPRVTPTGTQRFDPSVRSTNTHNTRKSVAATFENMPSNREYF